MASHGFETGLETVSHCGLRKFGGMVCTGADPWFSCRLMKTSLGRRVASVAFLGMSWAGLIVRATHWTTERDSGGGQLVLYRLAILMLPWR